jgi:hypothetical protein
MTALQERRAPREQVQARARTTPGVPRVNLLPPEVREARELHVVQRWLGIGLVGVLALCGLAWGGAIVLKSDAEGDLELEQARTAQIAAQTLQYNELQTTVQELDRAADLRRIAMTTDVEWSQYLLYLAVTAPEGMRFESVQLDAASVIGTTDQTAPQEAETDGFGTVSVVGRAPTLPDTSTWIEQVQTIPGVVDVAVSSAAYAGEEGSVFYRVQLTATLTEDAMSERYDDTQTEE